MNNYDYRSDSKRWVNFNSGRKKQKLRKFVSDIAQDLSKINNMSYNQNREKLVQCYNMDGMRGIRAAAKVLAGEKIKEEEE